MDTAEFATVALDLSRLHGDDLYQTLEHGEVLPEVPDATRVQDLVRQQAARSPSALAVIAPDRNLSYADLEFESSRLAGYLQSQGVAPDSLVGVCMERSSSMVVTLYAVLKAGGAYLPLEPEHPTTRLAQILEEATPGAIITQERLLDRLPQTVAPILRTDADARLWANAQPPGADPAGAGNLAYVLYTSGSTGRPKGVMIEHRSIVNHLRWRARWTGMSAKDRVIQKAPLGFDVSAWELFCPLTCGAATVLLEPGRQGDPAAIGAAIRAAGATMVSFAPSLLKVFLEGGEAERCDSLRLVMVGGETLGGALAAEAQERFGHRVQIANLYGPTETTVISTFWGYRPGDDPVPIGRPIANTQILVLDPKMERAEVGEEGEIFIGGLGVARGYLSRPDLTKQQFVDHPFRQGERLYRTGDRGTWRADGALLFGGRTDGQVKIRGNRIELAEIELALMRRAGLAQARVLVRPDAMGDPSLVAYVVGAGSQPPPSRAQLRRTLQEVLPAYMIPAEFMVVDSLPVTAAGKVDVARLPGMAVEAAPRELKCELFLVAAHAGDSPTLERFASALKPALSATVLPAPEALGHGPGEAPSELAVAVLAALRSARPRGPYLLAGYRQGGPVAYQIATWLDSGGEEVAWLGLYESPCHGAARRARRWDLASWRGSPSHGDGRDGTGSDVGTRGEGNALPLSLFASGAVYSSSRSPTLGWESVHRGRITPHRLGTDPLLSGGLQQAVRMTLERLRRDGVAP